MAAQAASITYGTINIPYAASSVCRKTALILGKPGGGKVRMALWEILLECLRVAEQLLTFLLLD